MMPQRARQAKWRVVYHGMCGAGHSDDLFGEGARLTELCDFNIRDNFGRGHIIRVCDAPMHWSREEYWR